MLDDLEKQSGARIGVMAIDTGNGNALFYRENERFLMCSTFKLSLVAAVLAKCRCRAEKLDRVVRYEQERSAGRFARHHRKSRHRHDESAALCEAAITVSDNTAANLLLASIGGPAGVTAFCAHWAMQTRRLDRTEPALNVADGDKDTTTPVGDAGRSENDPAGRCADADLAHNV